MARASSGARDKALVAAVDEGAPRVAGEMTHESGMTDGSGMAARARASSGARDKGLVTAVDEGETRVAGETTDESGMAGQQWREVATVSD